MAKAVKLKSNEKEKEYTDEFQNEFQNNKKQPIHIMGPKNIIIIIWE
jgi:ribosomal protein S17E